MFLHSTREGDYPDQIQHPRPEPNKSPAAIEQLAIAIAGLYAEQNILIFKVLASFLAGILKLMHHMVNLSNESGQA